LIRLIWLLAVLAGSLAAAPPAAVEPAGVPVLMYHKVDPHTPPGAVGRSLTLEPAQFEAQLAWLRAHAIRTLTMNDLADALRRGEHPSHAVVLTFDDGYSDAAVVVTPLLRKYGDRASFYVSAGFIGDGRHADWGQLRAMRAAGMEIGCHGTRHLDLSLVGNATAAREVNHCIDALSRYLGRPTTYAYPAGRWNAETLVLMRQSGMKAALTERPGVVTSLTAPYTLPRRRIDRTSGIGSFAALATP
jgi:peptidoglycan/xylan/chitin deacetylase (PgdA/CDA1 family)